MDIQENFKARRIVCYKPLTGKFRDILDSVLKQHYDAINNSIRAQNSYLK
jgi:hypothetical protein